MTTDQWVFSICVIAFTFSAGYATGQNKAEVTRIIAPKPQPCVTAEKVRKLYYDYGVEARKLRREK